MNEKKYEYTVLFEMERCALVERGARREYAVVDGLVPEGERKYEGSDWGLTVSYAEHSPEGLSRMLDLFRTRTEKGFVSRSKLEESCNINDSNDKSGSLDLIRELCKADSIGEDIKKSMNVDFGI